MKQFIILTVLFFALHSCKKEDEQLTNVVIPVDLSGSRDSMMMNWYKDVIANSILPKMDKRSRLTIIPIDRGSEQSGLALFSVDFTKNDYSNEFAGLQAEEFELNNHQDSVKAATCRFDQCFDDVRAERRMLSDGTDIIGALEVAKQYFVPGARNILILLCDMKQYDQGLEIDFEKQSLNGKGELVVGDKMEIVDLSDVEVVVLTGKQDNTSRSSYALIKDFWVCYFKSSGANLLSYSSGAVSKLEDVLEQKATEQ